MRDPGDELYLQTLHESFGVTLALEDAYPCGVPASFRGPLSDLNAYDPSIEVRVDVRTKGLTLWRHPVGKPVIGMGSYPHAELDGRLVPWLREHDLRSAQEVALAMRKAHESEKVNLRRFMDQTFSSVRDETVWQGARMLGVVQSQVPQSFGSGG